MCDVVIEGAGGGMIIDILEPGTEVGVPFINVKYMPAASIFILSKLFKVRYNIY
jgi:hypothetical protein